jgi:hypothetical protein
VCDRCRGELRTILRPMQVDIPVKDYFELFIVYTLTSGLRLDSELAKTRFVAGLSPENKHELESFNRLPSIPDIVTYLSAVEDFKRTILDAGTTGTA